MELDRLGNGFIISRQSCRNVERKETRPTYRTNKFYEDECADEESQLG